MSNNKKYIQPSMSEYDNGLFGLEFHAFNDCGDVLHSVVVATYTQSGSSMDTSGIDGLRQGVEMRTMKHWLGSNQPKIWAGNINHITQIHTYGQARSWVEYGKTIQWYDNQIEFNPVLFITNNSRYPYPIVFNGGPMDSEEASIEPLTIPYRSEKSYIEGSHPVHRPKGNLEDGNPTSDIPQSNNRILQFIDYDAPITPSPFLDAGQQYIGAGALEDCIILEGYVNYNIRHGIPFDDTKNEEIVKQLNVDITTPGSTDFIGQLKLLHIELEDDIRENYGRRSASAGCSIYGGNSARYGTDSIAFLGTYRGSTG
jgi:hypothetical protein